MKCNGYGAMKRILGLLVILPTILLALGYGAGEYLSNSSQDNANITADPSQADESDEGSTIKAGINDHAAGEKSIIVKLGQMIIPVYKARSVTYIVTNLGVSVSDLGQAEYYNLGENGSRLRDAIFAELKISADGRALRGASIDTEKLSRDITSEVKPKFDGISDVLFLSFYKRDIARS
jgi:hypothetical protein